MPNAPLPAAFHMTRSKSRVAVCSRSFSRDETLRHELEARYANVKFNDEGISLSEDSLVEFLSGADLAITALERIDEYVLSRLPRLKRISKYGVGLDMIDIQALKRFGKELAWKGGVNKRAVAELALTMMLTIMRKIPESQRHIASGNWVQTVGDTLTGKTIGIVGCGNVGQDLVRLLQPFDTKILIHDKNNSYPFFAEHRLEVLPLDEVLAEADVVTLHLPLDETTKGILSKSRLASMKIGSILINTARGGLVEEYALYEEIQKKRIIGAGLDVFEIEPPFDNKLLSRPEVFPTAHIGGSANEAIIAMGLAAIEGLSVPRNELLVS